jgi:hypothetical protein
MRKSIIGDVLRQRCVHDHDEGWHPHCRGGGGLPDALEDDGRPQQPPAVVQEVIEREHDLGKIVK